MIIAYCRVSTQHQKITRQVSNIASVYPGALVIKEWFTGTTQERPLWDKLMKTIEPGDTIVFDSVSRMSRNASEGFSDYKKLFEYGVNLEFLNEPLINTSVLKASKENLLKVSIETGNEAIDEYFKGNVDLINKLLLGLAEEQIKMAFVQSEKEVVDLHKRIGDGMREAKRKGIKIGLSKGTILVTKKEIWCKEIIKKHAKEFGGSLSDIEVMKLCGCSENTYYKYKKIIKNESLQNYAL